MAASVRLGMEIAGRSEGRTVRPSFSLRRATSRRSAFLSASVQTVLETDRRVRGRALPFRFALTAITRPGNRASSWSRRTADTREPVFENSVPESRSRRTECGRYYLSRSHWRCEGTAGISRCVLWREYVDDERRRSTSFAAGRIQGLLGGAPRAVYNRHSPFCLFIIGAPSDPVD